jgi:putative transposase
MTWKNESKVNQRLRLVQAMVRKEKLIAELCREAGVSRQTGYKFLARYEALGRAGLEDHSRANRASDWLQPWRRRVLALRRCWPTWGGAKLRHGLRQRWPGKRLPSQRTIERWLRQAGLSRQRIRRRRGHKMTVKCRVARSCNHVWTADLKGWFRTPRWPTRRAADGARSAFEIPPGGDRCLNVRTGHPTNLYRVVSPAWSAEDHPN